jgi:protein SCO1/2
MPRFLPLLSTWLAAVAVLAGCASRPAEMRGIAFDEPVPAPDVELVDQHGAAFRLAEQRGKVVVVFFGYAHCPDVCPVTLSTWARALPLLGRRADSVAFAFVTVDPERDDAARLDAHVRNFDETIRGLSGSATQLESAYKGFGVWHQKHALDGSATGYVVDHSTRMYLIDPDGNLRGTLGFDAPVEDLVHDIEFLLES